MWTYRDTKLEYLVLSLDIDMWWKQESNYNDNFFYSEYRQYPGYIYDKNHNFWEEGYPEGLAEASHETFNIDFYVNLFAPKLIEGIESLTKKHPNFILMDENRMGDHDYTDEMANNRDHLSVKGAARITGKLDSLILTLD